LKEELIPPGQRYINKWIIYAALGIPKVNVEEWKLNVTGLVERNLSLSYYELLKLPLIKVKKDFHCVTGWSIKDVEWEGLPIKFLAEEAKVKEEAQWVMFYCLDGYTSIIPKEDALTNDSIIALKINGKPLSLEQGFPARPFIPHLYGWKSAKWLTEIEFLKDYVDGYWEIYGYHERGNVWEEERFKGGKGKHTMRRSFGAKSF